MAQAFIEWLVLEGSGIFMIISLSSFILVEETLLRYPGVTLYQVFVVNLIKNKVRKNSTHSKIGEVGKEF